jgi:hypothetical protein
MTSTPMLWEASPPTSFVRWQGERRWSSKCRFVPCSTSDKVVNSRKFCLTSCVSLLYRHFEVKSNAVQFQPQRHVTYYWHLFHRIVPLFDMFQACYYRRYCPKIMFRLSVTISWWMRCRTVAVQNCRYVPTIHSLTEPAPQLLPVLHCIRWWSQPCIIYNDQGLIILL